MTEASQPLKAPFPAFGGKSAIAKMVWRRLGNVRNFIEPFCFSAAMLLKRPDEPQIETINDLNCYVSNFWRAIKYDPDATASYADWPVAEADMHARHKWLVNSRQAQEELKKVREYPDHFDARIAGWWAWGACMWIGSGWCDDRERGVDWAQVPGVDFIGVHNKMPLIAGISDKRPKLSGNSVGCGGTEAHEKRPIISNDGCEFGKGVHGRPQLGDQFSRGRGVHESDSASTCDQRRAWLEDWFRRLSDRLRPVRVCCGHWDRVCSSFTTLTRLGTTGVFLDPPYRKVLEDGSSNRAGHLYANDKIQDVGALCDEVEDWCLRWGSDPEIRVALCGLEGEYPRLDEAGWEKVPWKSNGGYGNNAEGGNINSARERLWFNKSCLPIIDNQGVLFGITP